MNKETYELIRMYAFGQVFSACPDSVEEVEKALGEWDESGEMPDSFTLWEPFEYYESEGVGELLDSFYSTFGAFAKELSTINGVEGDPETTLYSVYDNDDHSVMEGIRNNADRDEVLEQIFDWVTEDNDPEEYAGYTKEEFIHKCNYLIISHKKPINNNW